MSAAVVSGAVAREHGGDGTAGHLEESTQVHTRDCVVVLVGVVGERLADEDAGVVDERVDPTEPAQGGVDDPGPGAVLSHVDGHGQHLGIVRFSDGPGYCDDRVAELAVSGNQGGADAA